MTTLVKAKPRTWELAEIEELPIVANDVIYEGAAVGEDGNGYVRPLVAGDPFMGFAIGTYDNIGKSAGDTLCRFKQKGKIVLAVAGATAITANDRPPVYAADDDTFTLTATSNSKIGYVSRWISSGLCVVEFDSNPGILVDAT